MAIFGLVIFSISVFNLFKSEEDYYEELQPRMDSLYHLRKQKDSLENELSSIEKVLDNDSHVSTAQIRVEKLEEAFKHLDSKWYRENNLIDLEKASFERKKLFFNFLSWFGIILILAGFSFWYMLHQRYIDAERKYNGEKFIKKLRKSKKKNQSDLDS